MTSLRKIIPVVTMQLKKAVGVRGKLRFISSFFIKICNYSILECKKDLSTVDGQEEGNCPGWEEEKN